MVTYQFTLNYNATDYVLAANEEPKNFASVKSRIKRDFKAHGTFYSFTDGTLKLEFPGTGRTVLKDAFETEGVDAVVTLTVERQRQNETSFTTIFTGEANFLNYELNTDFVLIDFEEIDIQTKIRGRATVKYDTSKVRNLEGGTLAPDYSSINYNALQIYRESSIVANTAPACEVNYNGSEIVFDIQGTGQNKTIKDEIFFLNGERAAAPNSFVFGDEFPLETFDDGTTSVDGWNTGTYMIFYPEKGIDSYTVDIDYETLVSCTGTGGGGTIGSGGLTQMLLVYTVQAETNETLTEVVVDVPGNTMVAGDPQVSRTDNTTITVTTRPIKVYLGWRYAVGGSPTTGTLAFVSTLSDFFTFEASLLSVFPSTVINGQLIHEAIDKNLEYITGEQNLLYSDFFGRTDLGYSVDGCAGLFFETNGYNIRGDNRGIMNSLKNRLDSLNAIFNIGHGIQFKDYDKSSYEYRVEPSEYFYQDAEMASFTEIEKESYRESYFTDLAFNEIEVGFEKFAEGDEDPASLIDFFTNGSWSLPISNLIPPTDEGTSKKYTIISKYIASPYVWERTRRIQFSSDPTSTSKNDKDNFIVQLADDYPNFRQLGRSGVVAGIVNGSDPLATQPSEVRDSYFNFLIRPLYNLVNHGYIINSALFTKGNSSVIRNSAYEVNGDTVYRTTLSGTCLGLPDDKSSSEFIERSDLEGGSALFDPILINFKVSMTREQADDIILGHQNGLSANNYGYISVVNPDGVTKQGWVMDLLFSPVDEIGEFTLLKKA